MNITLSFSPEEFAGIRNKTLAELLTGTAHPKSPSSAPDAGVDTEFGAQFNGIDMEDVHDLTLRQVQKWMETASDKTRNGLRIIAEYGPIVRAQQLTDGGIDNISHFQSRTTIRTRTITGDRNAFLLGWDDWGEVDEGQGRYAVTPLTHKSLRQYFQLDV